ncbi:MAG: hypothetical protein R3264_12460, partial [Anaerolineae bacterium]|nr:hypothetical protein [Anaerolineae bacterium]
FPCFGLIVVIVQTKARHDWLFIFLELLMSNPDLIIERIGQVVNVQHFTVSGQKAYIFFGCFVQP